MAISNTVYVIKAIKSYAKGMEIPIMNHIVRINNN